MPKKCNDCGKMAMNGDQILSDRIFFYLGSSY